MKRGHVVFDEQKQINQSPHLMRKELFCSTFSAVMLAGFVVSISAQTGEQQAKSITLAQAIDAALQHNLDVQIERYNPMISRFALSSQYAGFDPSFNMSVDQRFSTDEGQFDQRLGVTELSGERWTELYSMGITGTLPTGTRYDIGADLSRASGKFSQLDPITAQFFLSNRRFQYASFAGISMSQPLLRDFWIDTTRANIAIAKSQLKITESVLSLRLMQTVLAVQQAYYDLIRARENVKVSAKARELFERLLLENRKKVEVGAMAPLDEKQAESQVASSKADLLSAQQALAIQENTLKNLMTDDYAAWQGIPLEPAETLSAVPIVLNLQDSWQRGLTQRPDLMQAKQDLENRNIRLRFSKNQLFPALDIRGSYGLNGVDENFAPSLGDLSDRRNPAHSVGAVITYPLGNIGARNRFKTNKAEKQQALLRLKKLEQDIMVQIDGAMKTAQTALERVEATKQARLFAEAALDAEQKKLENGKSTSFFVLQFQRDLTSARFDEIRALAEYNNALANLAFQEGATLERNGLQVKVTP